jgi:3-oxoacyl-[acyl-carrier-protein] synthase II
VVNVSTACAAGAYAVAAAADLLRAGEARLALAGGAESFTIVPQGCFNRLGALDPDRCRPFAAERRGTLFGEGAAFLLLEREDAFRERGGAGALAEFRGYGVSCDGHHATAPEPSGAQIRRAAREALERAGLPARAIDAVVAHGTGTQLNDEVEARLLEELFAERDPRPWTVPVKAQLGHGGGAAGAFSALVAALLIARQEVPPWGVDGTVDPACPVRLNTGAAVADRIRAVLVSAYAFGGNNISLVLGAPEPE